MKPSHFTIPKLIILIEYVIGSVLLGYLLYWHYTVGITRFFDVDEFTHLHWAANFARGQTPYIDFFTFFTPGFYWLLTPLFWLFGKSTSLFIATRVAAFVVFAVMVALTGLLYRTVRSKRFFLIPMCILAFLPMPFDKFMEVRPDNVSTVFGLLGMYLQIIAMENPLHTRVRAYWFFSAVSYAASMIILVKSLPFVVVGFAIYLLDVGVYPWLLHSISSRRIQRLPGSVGHAYFLYGFGVTGLLFAFWLLSLGDISRVLYSLTSMPFEANTIGRIYIMEPHLFFFPNASFYGGWGVTNALLLNHTIWAIGIFVGVMSLFTPYIRADGKGKRVLSELLIAGVFIVSVVLYVMFFPMKHSQYLIPIAVFIAMYCADFLSLVFRRASVLSPILLIALALLFSRQTTVVNAPKLQISNKVQLAQTEQLRSLVGENEQVLDLDGRFIYRADPYDICCLPFGTFVRFLSRPPRPLRDVLEEKKVAYIYQGDSGRFWELTEDLPYINEHYEKVEGWGTALWRRK